MKSSKQQQQRKQSKAKVVPVNTKAFTSGRWGAVPQCTDEYKTPKDKIWDNIIRHEWILERNWNDTWVREGPVPPNELPYHYHLRHEKKQKPKPNVIQPLITFYEPKPSPGVPVKASGMIGWRGADPGNSIEYFKKTELCAPPKKKFVKEQYGYYRIMKYKAMMTGQQEPDEQMKQDAINGLPQKFIRPIVKKLLW